MKPPLSIRIIYWLTNVIFWLLIFLTAVVFILNLVFLTDLLADTAQLRVQMPVPIEVVEDGVLPLKDSNVTVRIEEAYGKLYLVDTPFFITKMVARILFIVLLLTLYMTWRAKQFITNIKNGVVFELENINNLKQIAYGLAGLWLATRIYMEVVYRLLIKHLEFDTILIGTQIKDFDGVLVAAILLWALAHVFMRGHEMKKEQDLTI